MAYDKQALIDQLSTLTIMELADLIDGLKETWGVTAAVAMSISRKSRMWNTAGVSRGASSRSVMDLCICPSRT